MCRYAKLKSSSFSFAGFMTDKLAATLPHGALSGQDALCTQPIGMAQPAAQVTSHVYEGLFMGHLMGHLYIAGCAMPIG